MRGCLVALLLSTSTLVACGKNEKPPAPLEGPTGGQETGPKGPTTGGATAPGTGTTATGGGDPTAAAQQMFGTVCAACHGTDGTGSGPAAASLDPKPRNYTDAAWQASVTDDQIKAIIVSGGQAVGKSPMMPANPQLKDQPAVVDALVKIIRGFAAK